eukprot:evm.model.scf_1058.2 EVM.evm.TU.scf_1058.2   scf_1058:6445-10818(-)
MQSGTRIPKPSGGGRAPAGAEGRQAGRDRTNEWNNGRKMEQPALADAEGGALKARQTRAQSRLQKPSLPEAVLRGSRKRKDVGDGCPGPQAKRQPSAQKSAPPPPAEETFEELHERTGKSELDILSEKLKFNKGASAPKKMELMKNCIKDLRTVGHSLLERKDKFEAEASYQAAHVEELRAVWEGEEAMRDKRIEGLEEELQGAKASLSDTKDCLSRVQDELRDLHQTSGQQISSLDEALRTSKHELAFCEKSLSERTAKVEELEESSRTAQNYSTSLQNYNQGLQRQLSEQKEACQALVDENRGLKEQVMLLSGSTTQLEQKVEAVKSVAETKVQLLQGDSSQAKSELARLSKELHSVTLARDQWQRDCEKWKAQADMYQEKTGKSLEEMQNMETRRMALEGMCSDQDEIMERLRRETAIAVEQKRLAEELASRRGDENVELKRKVESLEALVVEKETQMKEGEEIRKRLHNTIMELKGNIRVFCRVRPVGDGECGTAPKTATPLVEYPSQGDQKDRAIKVLAPSGSSGTSSDFQPFEFAFDRVFPAQSTQEDVFDEISQLVQSALDGYKVCIFAYGQTGSGKTYTMLGNSENNGVIPRVMQQVFQTSNELREQGWNFRMRASILEVYNEEYKDLLGKHLAANEKHKVHHDAHGNTTVSGLTTVDVSKPENAAELLRRAMEKRAVGATKMNDNSSRSHMVFTLKLDGSNEGTQQHVQGVLNLIDLAGSERVKASGSQGDRLKEAQNINKSLSALGDVIMALGTKNEHVPYRNSKLTWLLQNSLSGASKVLMFVNISPAQESANESLCSLRFAAKVNACEIGVARRTVKTDPKDSQPTRSPRSR